MKYGLILMAICLCTFLGFTHGSTEKCRRRVCDYRLGFSWLYRHRALRIDPQYCTHLNLHGISLTEKQELNLIITQIEEFRKILDFKKVHPNLKLILVIPSDNFNYFITVYTTSHLKADFIRNIINVVRARNLDGLKIEVQPVKGGNKEKFTQFIQDVNKNFLEESSRTKRPQLILSVGIPSDKTFLDNFYNLVAISNAVDMIDLASYSFIPKNICVDKPQHHSPLYSPDPSSTKTIDYISRYVAEKGVRKDKINVGISFFMVTYTHWNSGCTWTSADIYYNSFDKCGTLISIIYKSAHFKLDKEVGRMVTWNQNMKKSFYEDADTIKTKVKYIINNGYGGVLMHATGYDDVDGWCDEGKYPLSRAVFEECRR